VDLPFLDSVLAEHGAPELIIDDGSHINEHIITTFKHLFPRLKEGGYYVIEDTQTSYWPESVVTARTCTTRPRP
jgi:demethylmacrocin O-methyltransferase